MIKSEKIRDTLSDWVQKYSDELYSRAYYKTSDRETAEDLVQETFLAAFGSFESFKGESSPKTWLFSILNNKIIDYYRKQAKSFLTFETSLEKNVFQETEEMFDRNDKWVKNMPHPVWNENTALLDDPDFQDVMNRCMKDLPKNWNSILLSKYLLGKEGREICKDLSISASNYWQILHRSKLMLKKCLETFWFN